MLKEANEELKDVKKKKNDLGSSLESCRRSRSFGCELDTEVCKKAQQDLTGCLSSFRTKNESFQALKEECDDLTEDWENVTALYSQCSNDLAQVRSDLEAKTDAQDRKSVV